MKLTGEVGDAQSLRLLESVTELRRVWDRSGCSSGSTSGNGMFRVCAGNLSDRVPISDIVGSIVLKNLGRQF